MRGVERSQSLRDSPSSLRPKVSFNRAVHIKRISRKDRLPSLAEDGDSPDYGTKMAANGIKSSPSKFSTLPSRSAQRNGIKKPETPAPSDRLSRLIRHDPKAEDSAPPKTLPPIQKQKKKTLGERVKGIFTRRKQAPQDDLKARYTEFKGRNSSSDATDNEGEQYTGKRRGSAPPETTSWFRSLERLKKPENGRRSERYFGESDRDSTSNRRGRMNDSSADSEAEGMGSRAPSLVYLHTAAVGDIPHRRTETPTRRLSRSVSVLAPWAPKLRPPRPSKPTRTRATQTEIAEEPTIIPIARPKPQARSLPKLVFTGPSIEETVSGRSTTSTIQRSTVHLRSRK